MSLSDRLARHAIGTANELEDDLSEAATTIETQAAEIERLRASLDEAVGVLRPFASWAEDNTEVVGDVTTGAYPAWGGNRCERERIVDWFGPSDFRAARDFITKHGGGRPAEQGVVMDFREEVQELTAIIRRQAINPNHGGERE